jgi:RHS repeat-associated protein
MRPTRWDVSNVLGYDYNYDFFNEHTGRVSYAGSRYDPSLDRSYEYDQVGRLVISHSGAEARAAAWTGQWGTMDGPYSQGYVFDQWGNMTQRYGWGGEVQGGGAGQTSYINYYYQTSSGGPNNGQYNNQRSGFGYDPAGNLTWDGGQSFQYDVTGQQTSASYGGYSLNQYYDGDGLRVAKNDNGSITYYLRSTVLGGQVISEFNYAGGWMRGYVYTGAGLMAILTNGTIYWNHEDPITKSKRITDSGGNVDSAVESDPWGGDTNRSGNQYFQPHRYTGYERDGNQSDEAMFRRYNRWHSRFDQPDPTDDSYNTADPQSFNRYAYVQNDPANFVDPSGLEMAVGCGIDQSWDQCVGSGGGGWGDTFFGNTYAGGNGWGHDPRPGLGIIQEAERAWDSVLLGWWHHHYLEGHEHTFSSDFDPGDDDYMLYVYKGYGKDLTRCINSIFGKAANKLEYQQMKNAPTVDRTKTMAELAEGHPGVRLAFGETKPDAAQTKTVYLASDIASSGVVTSGQYTVRQISARKYVHELGNYLSIKLSGDALEFGDGRGIKNLAGQSRGYLDYDTGARLESCVFAEGGPGS